MRSTRHRTAGVALIALALVLGCSSCANDDKAGVATAARDARTGGSSNAGTAKSWEAYDAAMKDLAACYREHGFPNATYEGHKSDAIEPTKELSGIPDLSKKLYPAAPKCRDKEPKSDLRPEPYAAVKRSPQEVTELRAVAKCMREKGLQNVQDPTDDISTGLWGEGMSEAKAGQETPEQRRFMDTEKECFKKLGFAPPGVSDDGSVG